MVDGKKIKELREAAEISQEALARDVGIAQPIMSYIERGLKQPSVSTLKRIADRLNVPMDDLVLA